MEKKNKIIIAVLIVVIVALAIGVATMIFNNSPAGGGSVPEGMQKYNFDSAFTMAVPKNTRFLKEFNSSSEFGQGVSYYDRDNKMAILYVTSPMITHEVINYFIDYVNSSGNATFEREGDLIFSHSLVHNGKLSKNLEDSNFTDIILIQRGHELVLIQGNDPEFIKSMAETFEWYE